VEHPSLPGFSCAVALLLLSSCAGTGQTAVEPQPAPAPEQAAQPVPPATAEPTPPVEPAVAVQPGPAERLAIADLYPVAEGIRGLRFVRPVEVGIEDGPTIAAHLVGELEEDDLRTAQVVFGGLGLLPADLDVRALLLPLLAEQVGGYYDPEEDRLVLRDDLARNIEAAWGGPDDWAADAARTVLVHELVHALQDQQLDLGALIDADRAYDADDAYRGLFEGDAMLAQIGHMEQQTTGVGLPELSRDPALMQLRLNSLVAWSAPSPALEAAPALLRVMFSAPYIHGLRFCAELYGRGGFAAIDAVHRAMPASTEQIMHPERYLRGELPVPIAIPPLPALEAAGLAPVHDDTIGELRMGIYFGQGTARDVDPVAADGWGGDRLRAYRAPDGEIAIVWFTAWDDEREAEQARRAAARVVTALPAGARARHRVERRGRAVLIVRGLDRPLQRAVADAFDGFAGSLPPPASTADGS
jgi:hypothetical protein